MIAFSDILSDISFHTKKFSLKPIILYNLNLCNFASENGVSNLMSLEPMHTETASNS